MIAPKCRVDRTRTYNLAESNVLETYSVTYTQFSRLVPRPLGFTLHYLRKTEVPTPKAFTPQSVFKTVPSPTRFIFQCTPLPASQLKVDQSTYKKRHQLTIAISLFIAITFTSNSYQLSIKHSYVSNKNQTLI